MSSRAVTLIIIALFSCFSSQLIAQNETYIEKYPDYFTSSLFLQNRSIRLNIKPLESERKEEIAYQPHVVSTGGVGLVFKRFGFRIGFKISKDPQAEEQFGRSRYFDLQLHSFGKKLVYDAYFQDYEGYFINNPQTVFDNWNSPILPQRGDLKIFYLSGNATYIFNPKKFSYRAVFIYDEAQRKSAGSFLLTGSLNYTKLEADSSVIPSNTKLSFPENADFNQANMYNFSVIPGYAHTFVIGKRLYLNLSLSMNIGLRYQQYGLHNFNESGIVPFFKSIGRTGLGYNSERFFVGFSLMFDTNAARMAQTQAGTTTLGTNIVIGYRFPTKLLRNYNNIFEWIFKKKDK